MSSWRAPARLAGALDALAGLALAILSAEAITRLAAAQVGVGLALLGAALVGRGALATADEVFAAAARRSLRRRWRQRLSALVAAPSPEGQRARGDLALAVDQVADAPALDALASAARVALVGLVVVAWAGGWLAALIVVALMGVAVPLYQRAGVRASALAAQYQERRATLEARQLELLHHSVELRGLGAVDYGADEIAALSDSEHSLALRALRVALGSSLVTEFLSGVSVGLVAMVVGFALLDRRTSLAHALIAVLVTSDLFAHVRRFGVEFHRRDDTRAALARLEALASVEPGARPPDDALLTADALVTDADPHPLTLRVAPGDRVLVSGPSGAGKTTLLHTLVGWRAARGGRGAHTDRAIGYVSADSPLVSGTLWENLTLGRALDEARVRRLLDDLGLDDARFADLARPLLADGRGLSSGERVRLVVARALLADAALVILDDVAGVLDEVSRVRLRDVLAAHGEIAIVEATVDTPVLGAVDQRVTVRA